ncbi:MAG: dioxygenase [Microbacterium sp.]|uniref:dioxygenase n=1 Tax=Microbacterium sp. TaxID=51671 RepID=UPI003A84F342
MATGGRSPKARSEREERERARVYQARAQFHDARIRRRTRDNVVAGVVGGLLIAGVIAGQIAYYVVGPGAPEPVPTPTPTVTDSTGPTPTPYPGTPTPSPTP